MKILHVSDLHYRDSAEQRALLDEAASEFERLHPDSLLLTGDVTSAGRDEQFTRVRHVLATLTFCQVLAIPGNRDAGQTATASPSDDHSLAYHHLPTPQARLALLDELDSSEQQDEAAQRAEQFCVHFKRAQFFYRDAQVAATGLHSTPDITARQMELASQHFLKGPPGELRIFCAHHSFLPVPTKKWKPGDTVPRSADILQTLIDLHVDLLCCGHIHRSHVWDLSDGGHRLLCCNAGSLLDTSGKKDNGYLEIEIADDLRITKRSLFTRKTDVLYHRHHFGEMLATRR